jgi:hypothetical protein
MGLNNTISIEKCVVGCSSLNSVKISSRFDFLSQKYQVSTS